MSISTTTQVLVEVDPVAPAFGDERAIKQVIRSYESFRRASEDLELLNETQAGRVFMIIEAPYIDN